MDPADLRHRLHRAVMRICPSWLRLQADDIVQAALLRVLAARDRRDPAEKNEENRELAASYLERAAYCALVDEIRRRRRLREVPVDERLETLHERRPLADPERTVAGHEFSRALLACLAGLLRPRRIAVTLYLHGHTVPEAARLLAWSPKRTQNLVTRGIVDLRGCLKAKGLEP